MRTGIEPTDSRTLRERIKTDGFIRSNPPRSPDANPYESRISELLARGTPDTLDEMARQERRLTMLREESQKWEADKKAREAEAKELQRISSDLIDAKTGVNLVKFSSDTIYTGEDVRAVERLLDDLKRTHDVAAYRAARDEFGQGIALRRKEVAAQLEAQAAEQMALAQQVRQGETE